MNLKNQKILVTGAGGFIGSHLVEELVKENANVKAFIKYNSKNLWGWLEYSDIKNEIEVISGDIRDYDSVIKAIKNIDIVFHLAALISIPYSYVSPLAYIRTNIEGTYNILQASLEKGIKKILHTSTSEVYGTAQYVPIDEKHPTNPQSPYAATKAAADQLALSYYRSFNLPVAIIRPFNTYGPRQSTRAVIPTIITQLLSKKNKLELGSLQPTRDFNYVLDTVNGFIAIAKSNKGCGEIINLGTDSEYTIKETAEIIMKLMGKKVNIMADDIRKRPSKSELERLHANIDKVKKLVGYKPKFTFKQGLTKTIKWLSNPENIKYYKEGYTI